MSYSIMRVSKRGKIETILNKADVFDYTSKCIVVESGENRILVIGWNYSDEKYLHVEILIFFKKKYPVSNIMGGGKISKENGVLKISVKSTDFGSMNIEDVSFYSVMLDAEMGSPYGVKRKKGLCNGLSIL